MTTFHLNDTVGTIVRDRPSLSRLFEEAKVDYKWNLNMMMQGRY
jgi:regulator of cell morphogenesis and NO signaling